MLAAQVLDERTLMRLAPLAKQTQGIVKPRPGWIEAADSCRKIEGGSVTAREIVREVGRRKNQSAIEVSHRAVSPGSTRAGDGCQGLRARPLHPRSSRNAAPCASSRVWPR